MPESSLVTISIEVFLLFVGCLLLWQHGLSKAGRLKTAEAARIMPEWDLHTTSFFLFLWMIFCGGLLGQSLISLFLKPEDAHTTSTLVFAGGSFHGGMLLGILLFKWFFDRLPARNPYDTSGWQKVKQGIATMLIVLPSLTAVGLIWQNLLHLFGVVIEQQELVDIFAKTHSPVLLTLMILLAVIVAPVTEEMIFRAGIFRFMRTRTPRWVALLVPALLFGALHANLASFMPLVALGIILSLAYERSGTILVPIIAHGLFNLNTILLILGGVSP